MVALNCTWKDVGISNQVMPMWSCTTWGPLLLQRSHPVTILSANGSAAFNESCASIGLKSYGSGNTGAVDTGSSACIWFYTSMKVCALGYKWDCIKVLFISFQLQRSKSMSGKGSICHQLSAYIYGGVMMCTINVNSLRLGDACVHQLTRSLVIQVMTLIDSLPIQHQSITWPVVGYGRLDWQEQISSIEILINILGTGISQIAKIHPKEVGGGWGLF